MSSIDHFAFLSPAYPLLYSLLKQAERHKENDTQVFLIKLRLFGELTCHELSEVLRLHPPVRGDFKNKIAQLKLSGKLPDHLIEGLESIRYYGNSSAHPSQNSVGQWFVSTSLSAERAQRLMQAALELAQHLCWLKSKRPVDTCALWQPSPERLSTDWVIRTVEDHDGDAALKLAKHEWMCLDTLPKLEGVSGKTKKILRTDKQENLLFWLNKAERYGAPKAPLFRAQCVMQGALPLRDGETLESLLKEACTSDDTGESTWQLAQYLQREGRSTALDWAKVAAKLGSDEALAWVLMQQDEDFETFLDIGLDRCAKIAFEHALARDFAPILSPEPSDEAVRAFRSRLIEASSRQVKGAAFYQSYCDWHGVAGFVKKTVDGKTWGEQHDALPSELQRPELVFDTLEASLPDRVTALRYGQAALLTVEGEALADLHFRLAMLAHQALQEKSRGVLDAVLFAPEELQAISKIKSWLQAAQKQGHQGAIDFLNSEVGRILWRGRLLNKPIIGKPTTNRKKIKQQRKARRRA